MVLDGYAVPYRQYMHKSELKYYGDILSQAKHSKSGLWKDRCEIIECLDEARKSLN